MHQSSSTAVLVNVHEVGANMGVPIVVDSIVKTMMMFNYMVYLGHFGGHSIIGLDGNHSEVNEVEPHDCRHVHAVNDELLDLATESCESLWHRFEQSTDEALSIVRSDRWKVEMKDPDMLIKKVYLPQYKRTAIMGETILNVSPEEALYIFWDIGKNIPEWNPEIIYLEDIVNVAANLRISYQVSQSKLGGLISPRDFLVVTGWTKRGENYYLSYTNVTDEYRPHPINSNYVRGINGPSIFAFERVPHDRQKTKFLYMLNYDMRLSRWLPVPQNVVDRATSAAMKDYLTVVRQRTSHHVPSKNNPHAKG